MCAPDGASGLAAVQGAGERALLQRGPRTPRHYGTIVVVGGGCYGSYYVRQLTRARDAGALSYERLLVVDRDPNCRLASARDLVLAGRVPAEREHDDPVRDSPPGGVPPHREVARDWRVERHHFDAIEVTAARWEDFLPAYFDGACAEPARAADDAVVPSPLMPHVTHDWLVARARRLWPDREVRSPALDVVPSTPWQRAAVSGGTHYVSFAEWMCPINCVEPRRCPETRGDRTWSMPVAAREYAAAAAARGRPLVGPLLFHCEHRAYGVGMFDATAAIDAAAALEAAVAAARSDEFVRALVASVSHCHGAWSVIELGAARTLSGS